MSPVLIGEIIQGVITIVTNIPTAITAITALINAWKSAKKSATPGQKLTVHVHIE